MDDMRKPNLTSAVFIVENASLIKDEIFAIPS